MTKKLISWLCFLAVFIFILQSCVHDEIYSSSDPSSKEYHSKSLWKEDEKYIEKFQKVFLEHANLENVRSRYGELYWDYAMSFGQFGEKYALVPVVKDNKVVLLMEAVRKEDKVYFYEKNDRDLIEFFTNTIFSPITRHREEKIPQQGSTSKILVCTTRTIEVGCANGDTNCTPIVKTQTVCELKESTVNNPKGFDPIGMSDGGGDPDGYEYPDPPEPQTPCEKTKSMLTDPVIKAKLMR